MPLTFHDDLVMVWGKYLMRHITPPLRLFQSRRLVCWVCLHLFLSSTWFAMAFCLACQSGIPPGLGQFTREHVTVLEP